MADEPNVITDEMRAAVGKESEPSVREVDRTQIRLFANSLVGHTDPIDYDVEAAKAAGYRDLPAPPGYLGTPVFMPGMPARAAQEFEPAIPMNRRLNGGTEIEYFGDIVAGDVLTATSHIASFTQTKGSIGTMLVITERRPCTRTPAAMLSPLAPARASATSRIQTPGCGVRPRSLQPGCLVADDVQTGGIAWPTNPSSRRRCALPSARNPSPRFAKSTVPRARLFARSVGHSDPVYYEVEAARAAGYRDLPAPPGYLGTPLFNPANPARWIAAPEPAVPLTRGLNGGTEFEYFEDIVAGDVLTATTQLADIAEARGSLGVMLITTTRTTFRNAAGRIVATETGKIIRY